MSTIGCKIINEIERASKEQIMKFKEIPVANLDDCMNRLSAIDSSIRPFNQSKILGSAFTVKVPSGDNLMFHQAMDMAQEGDVIMIDAGGCTKRAILGELMVTYLELKGVAGIVVDGAIRDVDQISNMEFPVYAKGVTPDGPYKNGPGEINTPVVIGGRTIFPGDIIIGDADGVIAIRPDEAEELLSEVKVKIESEEEILRTMREEGTYIRPWLSQKLKEIGCVIK